MYVRSFNKPAVKLNLEYFGLSWDSTQAVSILRAEFWRQEIVSNHPQRGGPTTTWSGNYGTWYSRSVDDHISYVK